jgi:ferric-dicitrate binding protein FerR (iron transport regulator)
LTPPDPRWLDSSPSDGEQALRRALDDAAQVPEVQPNKQRVWARVQTPWAPSRARLALGFGLGAAAITGVVLVLVTGHQRHQRSNGGAEVGTQAAAPATATAPNAAPPAPPEFATGTLLTGPGEQLQRRLARGVDVVLAPLGALIAGDAQTAPEVKSGRARFSVPHQAPGQNYVVRAAGYRVLVLGTVFEVAVDAGGVSVALDSGVVEIESAAGGRRVAHLLPGQRWSSTATNTTAAARDGASRAATSNSAAPDTAAILAAARRARGSGDARGALALYGRLASSRGQLAESALYEMASIEDQDLHDAARALHLWERYRDQHPRGVLRAEADLSIIEMLTQLGQNGRAVDEARGFLRRNPGSERRGEVARVAGDLSRTRGDCAVAVAFYDQAAASRLSPADADDAGFYRAACLATLGDGRAADAVRAYLGRYPRGRHASEAERLRGGAGAAGVSPRR